MIPRRARRPKMGVREETVIRCPGHLKWVRGHECATCPSPIVSRYGSASHPPGYRCEAAHVRTGTDGGTGMKPGDNWAIPLCHDHHQQQHRIGEKAFEAIYHIDMKKIAETFWRLSPHRINYERRKEKGNV